MKAVALFLVLFSSISSFGSEMVFRKDSRLPDVLKSLIVVTIHQKCTDLTNKGWPMFEVETEQSVPADTMSANANYTTTVSVQSYDKDNMHPGPIYRLKIKAEAKNLYSPRTASYKVLSIEGKTCTYIAE